MLQQELNQLKQDNQELRRDGLELEQMLVSRQNSSNQTVAFCAYVNSGDNVIYAADEIVAFNGILHNDGGYYNEDLSVFTCPVTGLYSFSISVRSVLREEESFTSNVVLVKGEENLGGVATILSSTTGSLDISGSNSVVITCSAGEAVFVEAATTSRIYGGSTYRTSTFSGFLMAPSNEYFGGW